MKKFTLIALTLLFSLSISAQEYKKSWNFTKWSAETVGNLIAGSDWSDIEKASSTEPTEESKEKCFWEVTSRGTTDGATLTANGTTIAELDGLLYTNTANRSLAIAVDYPTTSLGTYHGGSYLWLGSSKKNYFIIPHVAAGTTITMGVESHKPTEARGINLYVGHGSSGTQLKDPDGNAVAAPTEYTEQTWLVPTDLTDEPNADGTYDITIYNTNGCHLYFITVGDGSPVVEENKKVAYVYSPAADYDPSADIVNAYISGGTFDVTNLSAATAVTLDSLQKFDAVVIGNNVAPDAALVPVLKTAVAYEPVVNLNSKLYAAWGHGSEVATTIADITINDPSATLFKNWDGFDTEASTLNLLTTGSLTGVSLGNYFSADDVLAKVGDAVAIHQHNPLRNTYIFLPLSNVDLMEANQDNLSPLLLAALKTATDTKVGVTKTTQPVITETYKDGVTEVAITARDGAIIYYTTDGTEPTQQSTVYTEALSFTSPATVKAVAFFDGYLLSNVSSKDITVKNQAKVPTIVSVEQVEGKSTVTLSQADGVSIYYNFTGSTVQAASQLYSAPVELTEKATITAFAAGGDFVQSEPVSRLIEIQGQTVENNRDSVLAHFNGDNSTSAYGVFASGTSPYLFSWGKTARSMYSDPEALTLAEPEEVVYNGWRIKSYGQVVTEEGTAPGVNVGDGSGYNPATVFDALPQADSIVITKGVANFKGKTSGEPYNASIETTEPYQGPFDVVSFIYNGAGNEQDLLFSVSTDGNTWTQLSDTIKFNVTKRLYKRFKLSYEGTDKVYVKLAHVGGSASAMVADIYLLGHDNSVVTGISNVNTGTGVKTAVYYSVNGAHQSGLKRGVNIVKYTDGTVRKVIVK